MTAVVGDDGLRRCGWAYGAPEYIEYHDGEWGRAVHGDDAVFERMVLEAFQSGLSWITILRKRAAFRAAFAGFSMEAVAQFTDADVARLMADVEHRAEPREDRGRDRERARRLGVPEGLSELVWSFAPTRRRKGPSDDRRRPGRLARVDGDGEGAQAARLCASSVRRRRTRTCRRPAWSTITW